MYHPRKSRKSKKQNNNTSRTEDNNNSNKNNIYECLDLQNESTSGYLEHRSEIIEPHSESQDGVNLEDLNQRPELIWKKSLTLQNYKELSRAAKSLLNAAPDYLQTRNRLELEQNDFGQWQMVLKFSPLDWFDYHLKTEDGKGEDDERLKTALLYVEKERKLDRASRPSLTLPKVESTELCPYRSTCKNITSCDRGLHSRIYCGQLVSRRGNASKRPCNWSCDDKLLIKETESFILMARPESTRDLLLLPKPLKLKEWRGHKTNAELVVAPFFWENVLKMITSLHKIIGFPVDTGTSIIPKIALNFGTWETGQSVDHRAIDCHGHAHLELTLDAANALAEKFECVDGRFDDPENYRKKNCDELERERLNNIRLNQFSTRLDQIRTENSARFDNIEKMLKEILDRRQ